MIVLETNRFQILNPDILKIIYDYGEDLSVQITYMCKEMHRSTVSFTPVLPFIKKSNTITHLCSKATKVMFKLCKSILHTSIKLFVALMLFDTMIRPIATYGREIWGSFINNIPPMFDLSNNNYKATDNWCYEKLDLRFCKSLLGVHRKLAT